MTIQLEDLISNLEQSPSLSKLISHLSTKKLLEDLLISPDLYETTGLYDNIYENFAGELTSHDFLVMTEQIDAIYRQIFDKVTELIKVKYAQESFIFHRWLDEQTAVIGSAEKIPVPSELQARCDPRYLRFNDPLPWEP